MFYDEVKILSEAFYKEHLKRYSPYTFSEDWIRWGTRIIPFRAKRTAKILSEYVGKDARILDLGCGIGLSLHVLAQIFPNIIGCDIDEEILGAARVILKEAGVGDTKLVKFNGSELPFRSKSFDAVSCIEVVEHVKSPALMLKEIKRVLKKTGILLITTPNKFWPIETHYRLPFLAYLPARLSNLYVKFTGRGEKYNVYPLSYTKFFSLVNKYFEIEDITFNIVKRYKDFKLDNERGGRIKYAAYVLQIIRKLNLNSFEKFLLNFSEGWVFVARKK